MAAAGGAKGQKATFREAGFPRLGVKMSQRVALSPSIEMSHVSVTWFQKNLEGYNDRAQHFVNYCCFLLNKPARPLTSFTGATPFVVLEATLPTQLECVLFSKSPAPALPGQFHRAIWQPLLPGRPDWTTLSLCEGFSHYSRSRFSGNQLH